MDQLVKNRGLSGSQSRKKWRKNIDVTGLMKQMETKHTQALRQQQQKKNPQLLVVEDTTASKKTPLDPHRFKKKAVDPKLLSKHETRRVAELSRRANQNQSSQMDEEVFDAWKSDMPIEKPIHSKKIDEKEVKVPSIITPIGGESYNPHEKDFVKMVDQIIDIEVKKPTEMKLRRVKRIKKLIPRARNKIMRMEQLRAVQNRKLKQQQHQLMHMKRLGKDVDQEMKKAQETSLKTKQKQEQLRQQMETGRIKLGPKLAKQRYTYKQDIIPDMEPVPLSKQPFRESAIRDRYDSIFRRGIFEPKRHTVMINRTRNIKVKKNTHQD